ncbi:hypothetical protein GQ53DRAFT_750618 [Thozetella sp. PMI_491]|nr:hypothetical protein GQ53DRAFT_750618 [Thozetella sp. PMI_491]
MNLRAWSKDRELVVASFFFWNSGTKLQKSQEGLLRSLLFEILRLCPKLIAGVHKAIIDEDDEIPPDTLPSSNSSLSPQPVSISWRLADLLKAFEYLRGQEMTAKFCFFIDGLDEYKEEDIHDPRDLIRVLRGLAQSSNIKLCLSSRSWTVFKDAFGSSARTTLKLEDLTRKDIRRYVTDNFNAHEQFSTLSLLDPAYADLIEEVVRKAQGVFLWVFLVVRDLLDGLTYNDTIKTMRRRLDRFPDDLEAYFRHIFDSIHQVYRVQTARTFQIAMSRDEPLPLITYSFVDDVEEDPDLTYSTAAKLSAHQIEAKLAAMRRRLEGRSKGLLEVAVYKHSSNVFQTVVEFLHRTVRDFLLHTPDIQDKMMESLENKYQTWVLLCRASSVMMKTWRGDAFVTCAHHLCYYARLAITDSGSGDIVDDIFLQVFPALSAEASTASEVEGSYRRAGLVDMCLASKYGLVNYVQKHLPARVQLIEQESHDNSERKRASRLGRILRDALLGDGRYFKLSPELVEYLVSIGASPNRACRLHDRDDPDTIFYRFLLRLDERQISPKDPAVLNIVKTLVAYGADLDAKSSGRHAPRTLWGQSREKADNVLARNLICKHFTIDESNYIFSHATKGVAEPLEGGKT